MSKIILNWALIESWLVLKVLTEMCQNWGLMLLLNWICQLTNFVLLLLSNQKIFNISFFNSPNAINQYKCIFELRIIEIPKINLNFYLTVLKVQHVEFSNWSGFCSRLYFTSIRTSVNFENVSLHTNIIMTFNNVSHTT